MSRVANTDHPIHKHISGRYSPYAFDPDRDVSLQDQSSLLEAARWAASSFNAQPWRYVVGSRSRNEALWQAVLGVLVEPNQAWAKFAPVLMLGCYRTEFEFNGKPNGCALHDLGAASASLNFEASARGINVHQMAGIVPERAKDVFDLPDNLVPFTALAVGYAHVGPAPGDLGALAEKDTGARERKPQSDIILQV
ncbi:MAG: nitroreductase family protein [Gammaproteobacteria bacterium]